MSVEIQTRYNRRLPVSLSGFDQSKTQQHFAEEVNIHSIVERSKSSGVLAGGVSSGARAVFGDFSVVTDYQSACEALAVSEDAFMQLPAAVRFRFNNDPGALLSFVADPSNKDEAVKLGLVEAAVAPPSPVPVPPAPAPAPVPVPPKAS